ncbi:MAG: acyltransferase [Bacteroides sp.]|nr:acyltransferase [Bacteroides sp.]
MIAYSSSASAPSVLEREHYAWVDILRVVACFMVVLAHACDAFVGQFDTDRVAFLSGVAIGSLMRPCVPLFVMMTAVVLLPLRSNVSAAMFYRKRVGRLIVPLIFWSLALPVMMWCYYNQVNPSTVNPLLSAAGYTTPALWNKLSTWVVNFNYDTTPLWYLYMLMGIYLVIPVIDGWLRTASRRDIKLLLIVWAVAMLLPWVKMAAPLLGYTGNYGNMGIWGECDWNPYGTFYYVSGFAGYVVLAYYLRTWPLRWNARKMAAIFIPMFAVGYAITFAGFLIIQVYYPGNYAYLEIIWYFCGLNVLMMTFPFFAAMQRLGGNGSVWMRRLAALTFGIYLCHFPFEYITYDWLDSPEIAPAVRIISGGIATFVIAAGLTWLLSLWAPTRRLIA